ncbi:MAG TPA: aminopeptidase [Clostridia bacterium]|nr:aminopeptidase [Clostridia bacterium]
MYQSDLQKATNLLVNDLLKTKKDEIFVITADTEADDSVIKYIARSASMAGAKAMVVLIPTPLGVSMAADPFIPLEPLCGVLENADIWVELNNKWLLYSTPFYRAKKNNPGLRHMCLTGTGADTLVQCVGKVDYETMRRFSEKLCEKIRKAENVRMVFEGGDEVTFRNAPEHPVSCKLGYADKPGTHLFVGQISWTPELESIRGTICLNGSIAPDIGLLQTAVKLEVEKGRILSISGGKEAKKFEDWLRGFNHAQMLCIAHAGLGFNPGAKLAGDILQDQRVWGSATWGFGSIGAGLLPPNGVEAPSHSDTVSINISIYLDGKPLWLSGDIADEELIPFAKQLKKQY